MFYFSFLILRTAFLTITSCTLFVSLIVRIAICPKFTIFLSSTFLKYIIAFNTCIVDLCFLFHTRKMTYHFSQPQVLYTTKNVCKGKCIKKVKKVLFPFIKGYSTIAIYPIRKKMQLFLAP